MVSTDTIASQSCGAKEHRGEAPLLQDCALLGVDVGDADFVGVLASGRSKEPHLSRCFLIKNIALSGQNV